MAFRPIRLPGEKEKLLDRAAEAFAADGFASIEDIRKYYPSLSYDALRAHLTKRGLYPREKLTCGRIDNCKMEDGKRFPEPPKANARYRTAADVRKMDRSASTRGQTCGQ